MPSTFPIDIGVTAHFGRRLSRNGPKTATASIKDGKEGEPLSRIKVGEDYERARKVRGEALPMDVRLTPISLEKIDPHYYIPPEKRLTNVLGKTDSSAAPPHRHT